MTDRRERLRSVGFKLRRPNEYTTWKPRVERGPGFGMAAWGVFFVDWDTEYIGSLDWEADADRYGEVES